MLVLVLVLVLVRVLAELGAVLAERESLVKSVRLGGSLR